MKFAICPEVCPDCESGKHIFHILDEFGDIYAYFDMPCTRSRHKKVPHQHIIIGGHTEDLEALDMLLQQIKYIYSKEEIE